MTLTRRYLLLFASALLVLVTPVAAQVPSELQSELEPALLEVTTPELEEPLAAVLEWERELSVRNRQVQANLEAVKEVLETRARIKDGTIAIGDALRAARGQAPAINVYRQEVSEREHELAKARLAKVGILERMRLAEDEEAEALVQTRLDDQETYIKALVSSLETARELEANAHKLLDLLNGHLLWLRSADPIGKDWFGDVAEGAVWLVRPKRWQPVLARLKLAATEHLILTCLGALLIAGSILQRAKMKAALDGIASSVGRVASDSFLLTVRALAITLLLALPIPLVLLGIGALLTTNDHLADGTPLTRGFIAGGAVYLMLEFARQMCCRQGLAQVHFRWDDRARSVLRSNLPWLIVTQVVAVFVVIACEASGDDTYRLGLGRLAFATGSFGLALFMSLVFHPDRGALSKTLSRTGWAWKLRRLWYALLVLAPVGLGIAAATGYYYTAIEVQSRFFTTGLVALVGVVTYSLCERWLLVERRRFAVRQARQRLAQAREARANQVVKSETEELASGNAVPELDLQEIDVATISTQTLVLVRTLVMIGAAMLLWIVWDEMLPALAVLDNMKIGSPTLDANGKVVVEALTLWSMLAALLTALLTFLAARNLPSILELAILARFKVDAGVRYAAGTLTRYVVVALGFALIAKLLGVNWSNAQWIIAALGVGLGFGLQEIVANFVSGLIILFERPIRVGDTVTVGEDSGTVSRLQIRATTIVDWDNKEILVPNKNFITERVVNWTLSDPVTRVIAKVGVAYGTDVTAARQAITSAVKSVSNVLETPTPSVFFLGFGDSSLDFEVRAFVDDLSKRLPTLHEINLAIDQALNEAGIEIPFPQRDLHVRSDDTKQPAADDQ